MFTSLGDVKQWIKAADDEFSHAQAEYQINRKYYENIQYPTNSKGESLVPDDYSYIVVNKCKPHVNLQVSKVVGGKIDKTLKGEQVTPLENLLDKICEKNKFHEEFIEKVENFRQVEGLAGIKFEYDPYEDSEFGLGFPKFHAIWCGDGAILLDPNATDGTHTDDGARAYRKRITIKEAMTRPEWKKHREQIKARADKKHFEDRMHLDLYEIEFVESYLVPSYFDPNAGKHVPIMDFVSAYTPDYKEKFNDNTGYGDEFTGDFTPVDALVKAARELLLENNDEMTEAEELEFIQGLPLIRVKVMLCCKVLGGQDGVLVEEPKPTGYSGFTIIPSMHTIRTSQHKYPSSDVFYLRLEQDKINMLNSMAVESVKLAIKNVTFITGVDGYDEEAYVERKIGNIASTVFLRDASARVTNISTPSIPAPIMQLLELSENNFDYIGNTGEPDRGQPLDLSGTAIQSLQARFDIPLYVSIVHLESSLVELFRRILECVTQKMTQPFTIQREIDGEKRKIYYNTPKSALQGVELNDDEMFVMGKDESGNEVVNYLPSMNVPDVGVDITTNTLVKEQEAVSKAMAMYKLQQLHPQRLHKAVYPESWTETWQEAQEWNQGLALTQQLGQLSPASQEYVQGAINEAMMTEQVVDKAGLKD